jgi:hypothetical protein
VAMANSNGHYRESYTAEYWSTCFTARAQCVCNISSTATPTSTPVKVLNCSDPDGGINYAVASNVTLVLSDGSVSVSPDFCIDSVLIERYCATINGTPYNVSNVQYSCPYGCSNGACVNATVTPTPTPVANCTDSDGGLNYGVKGTATKGGTSITDSCYSPAHVYEMYCSGNELASGVYACPSGTTCSDGACIATPTPTPTPIPSGACQWVGIDCSHYGGYWPSSNLVNCTSANNGLVAMANSNGHYRESYTAEYWSTCFTARAQCVCNSSGNYSAPSAGTGLVVGNTCWCEGNLWCRWC